eukprot:33418-Eustigmatos_ZCMA.PRE.1
MSSGGGRAPKGPSTAKASAAGTCESGRVRLPSSLRRPQQLELFRFYRSTAVCWHTFLHEDQTPAAASTAALRRCRGGE